MIEFENIPLLETFKGLERKDRVYSARLGLGVIFSIYNDNEVIVNFPTQRIRIAIEDSDLRLVPKQERKRATSIMMVNGQKMGRRNMVKYMRKNQER